jgi:RimJ/RimL family protein N-acetyltransferase
LSRDDSEALYRIASDPAVWEQHPSKDRTQEPVFRDRFEQALASRGALAAVDLRDGGVIGTSRYVVRGEDEVEIGWTFLARDRWGGLWNGEMKRLMLDHAFASVSTVLFTVHSDNVRSQRSVERLGAVRVGTEVDAHGRGTNIVFRLSGAMT